MTIRAAVWIATLTAIAGGAAAQQSPAGFDHAKHRKLFPTCVTCHAGAARADAPMFPDSASCAVCHDGVIQDPVAWRPPPEPRHSNLRFDHQTHAAKLAGKTPAACADCHEPAGAVWMAAAHPDPIPERCLACHGVQTAHLAAPDTACATCHLPLARAVRLTARDVARFPTPPDHKTAGFAGKAGHGAAATATQPIAASCATCHARDFCLQCHVAGPAQVTIEALARDSRATAIRVRLAPPATHGDPAFRTGQHAGAARAAAAACAGCHVRADCLECHRGSPARAAGYHAAGFLARHPAAAYARETSCSSCHNTRQFCTACHARVGLAAQGPLRPGYHDANQFFILGHGGAARQNLESCVSCHAERDCLTCHSALGGRRIDPHGPGFDPARMIKKNPQMCTACHGTNIPTP